MEIEDYVRASRRNHPDQKIMHDYYTALYTLIKLQFPAYITFPKLFVSYSSDRRCEQARIQDSTYIIYDQYLGQGFDRLNRILKAKQSWHDLTVSFALKCLAQKLITRGATHNALIYAIHHDDILNRVKEAGNPFAFSKEEETYISMLTMVQECFILSHEFSHFLISHGSSLEENGCDRVYAEALKLISQPLSVTHLKESTKRYGKKWTSQTKEHYQSFTERMVSFFKDSRKKLLPEMLCDQLATKHAMRVIYEFYDVPMDIICEGIFLAFKHSRMFRHLELLADNIVPLDSCTNQECRQMFMRLPEEIWHSDNVDPIYEAQIRQRYMRLQLYLYVQNSERAYAKLDGIDNHLKDVSDFYDEKIEDAVLINLVARILTAEDMTKETEFLLEGQDDTRLLNIIDSYTGWK